MPRRRYPSCCCLRSCGLSCLRGRKAACVTAIVFDRHGDQIFYGMLMMGSLTSLLAGAWKFMLGKPNAPGGAPLDRLHGLTMRIREANSESELELIEDEINKILRDELSRIARDESEASALGVAVTRLEHLINQRGKHLGIDRPTPAQ